MADFLPVFHILGAILILLTDRQQRLGDMAAGTIVIRERVESPRSRPVEGPDRACFAGRTLSPPRQLATLTATDRNLLREFLRRHEGMDERNWERLALKMAAKYREKTASKSVIEIADGTRARAFLASLLRDLELTLRDDA